MKTIIESKILPSIENQKEIEIYQLDLDTSKKIINELINQLAKTSSYKRALFKIEDKFFYFQIGPKKP